MTEFCPEEKATILAIAGKIDHLHVICTKQFFYKKTGANSVLAVNVSSIREGTTFDEACVLHAGDHSFITHDSYVRYKDAVVMRVDRILSAVESGEITVMEHVSDEVFQRILSGFDKSKHTRTKIKKLLRQCTKPESTETQAITVELDMALEISGVRG